MNSFLCKDIKKELKYTNFINIFYFKIGNIS